MEKEKPLILVTNDDGIQSKGIMALVEATSSFGEIVIVAPDKPQSGVGHSITIRDMLRLKRSMLYSDYTAYACSGTPVDCVKLAIGRVLKRKPDLIVSGINHGANHASNVIYSGTMSAAIEGAMEDIPSIGFSLLNFKADADFSAAKKIVEIVVKKALTQPFSKNRCLNVNIPDIPYSAIKGIKICRQAAAYWSDDFEKRLDPMQQSYYWMAGEFLNEDMESDTDAWALANNYVSIVPIQYDLTAYDELKTIKNWKL